MIRPEFVGPLCPGHTYLLWSMADRFTFRVAENGDWLVPAELVDGESGPWIPGAKILKKCPDHEPIRAY